MTAFTIIIDSREQAPYSFNRWPEVCTEQAALSAGDYSVAGFQDRVGIERKSLDDLVSCLMGKDRQRFEKELARLRAYEMTAVIVEADLQDVARGRYRSQMKPQAALQTITAFHIRYGTPFLFCGNRAGAEYMTYSLLSKYLYEIGKRYDQARRVTA